MDKCNSVCPIPDSERVGAYVTKRKIKQSIQTVLHVMFGLLIVYIDAMDSSNIAEYVLVDFLIKRNIISGTPDQSSGYFYTFEITHIPMHTRSSSPYVSSLPVKSVPYRFSCETSITNAG